jgi:hypothetical protein
MPYSDKEWFALSRCAPDTGEEFDWYALDRVGHLAVFTTAGAGPIPAAIWSHRKEFYELKAAVDGLPGTSSFEKVFTGSGNVVDWCDFARKGLFAFDYQDVHRTVRLHGGYDLIARPCGPAPALLLLPGVDLRWLPVVEVGFAGSTLLPDAAIRGAELIASPYAAPPHR